MMARLFSLTRERTFAVVDIGSGYVGCAILKLSGKRAHILSHARSTLTLEARDDAHARARLAEEIAEATKAASARVPGIPVSDVFVVLHPPWTASRILAATAVSKNDTVIRAAHISKLAENALQAAPEIDRSLLFEMTALSIRLNGYPTNEPEGKRAKQVELFAIASATDPALRQSAETAVHAAFPAARIAWRSATRTYASVLHHMTIEPDITVIDFGVQATSVSVLRDGLPAGERLVAEGLQSVLTRVQGARPPQESLGLLRMLERDACADDACTNLQTALAAAEPELVKVFGEAFAALAEPKRLPSTLILIAHPDIAPWLKHFFERIDFTQFTLTAQPFSTRILSLDDCLEWLQGNTGVDAALSLASSHALFELQST